MTISEYAGGKCQATVVIEEPRIARIVDCGKPSVLSFTNWAGRTEVVCREHATAALVDLKAIIDRVSVRDGA